VLSVQAILAVFIGLSEGDDSIEGATDGPPCPVEGASAAIIKDAAVDFGQELSFFAQIDAKGSYGGIAHDHAVEDVFEDLGFMWVHGVFLSGQFPSLEDVLEVYGIDGVMCWGLGKEPLEHGDNEARDTACPLEEGVQALLTEAFFGLVSEVMF
jgi:hypothetical protein